MFLAEFRILISPNVFEVLLKSEEDLRRNIVSSGRSSYENDMPYYFYAELINAVVDHRRDLKKSLTAAWDFADLWRSLEPTQHRKAITRGLFRALVALALSWGWVTVACVIAFCWTAMCRVGEFLSAISKDLLLPSHLSLLSFCPFQFLLLHLIYQYLDDHRSSVLDSIWGREL